MEHPPRPAETPLPTSGSICGPQLTIICTAATNSMDPNSNTQLQHGLEISRQSRNGYNYTMQQRKRVLLYLCDSRAQRAGWAIPAVSSCPHPLKTRQRSGAGRTARSCAPPSSALCAPLVPAPQSVCPSTQQARVPVHFQGLASAPLTVPSLQGSSYAGSVTSRTKERLQCFCEGAGARALREAPLSRVVATAFWLSRKTVLTESDLGYYMCGPACFE